VRGLNLVFGYAGEKFSVRGCSPCVLCKAFLPCEDERQNGSADIGLGLKEGSCLLPHEI